MPRPPATARVDSRARLLAAARAEFAARGYAGARLDHIARKARVTKAMVHYHFRSKEGLYRDVIRETFDAIGRRMHEIAASAAPPPDKLRAFIDAVGQEAMRRPDFPAVMLREVTEQGRHLDAATIGVFLVVPETFMSILAEGVARGAFRPVQPLVAYFSVLGPIVLSIASGRARERIARLSGRPLPDPGADGLIAQVQATALALVGATAPADAPLAEEHA